MILEWIYLIVELMKECEMWPQKIFKKKRNKILKCLQRQRQVVEIPVFVLKFCLLFLLKSIPFFLSPRFILAIFYNYSKLSTTTNLFNAMFWRKNWLIALALYHVQTFPKEKMSFWLLVMPGNVFDTQQRLPNDQG